MKPAPHPRAVRKPRKPKNLPNCELWNWSEDRRDYIKVIGCNAYYGDILRSSQARRLAKRLVEMADWIDAQQPARWPAGKGKGR